MVGDYYSDEDDALDEWVESSTDHSSQAFTDQDAEDEDEGWSSEYSFLQGDESDFEPLELVLVGKVVERLKIEELKDDENKDAAESIGVTDEMWLTLPDEVMISIRARLPFSSFCCFRSVCKKWNALAIYPDASLTTARDYSDGVPFCVMNSSLNQYVSYNPSTHCWHDLPPSFGSSFNLLGFNCDDTRVLAGSGGLLLLESLQGLWLVNPMNKSKRRLPPLLVNPITEAQRSVPESAENLFQPTSLKQTLHFHWDEVHSSFVIVSFGHLIHHKKYEEYGSHIEKSTCFEIHIYDSRNESWQRCRKFNYLMDFSYIMSTVEFDGAIFCLYSGSSRGRGDCYICIFASNVGTAQHGFFVMDSLDVPRRLRGGQLAVRDGNLMLGGVVRFFRDGQSRYSACMWKLEYKWEDLAWQELTRMPAELVDELTSVLEPPFLYDPHVVVHGDYMWVTITTNVIEQSTRCCGIMCHIPTNTWWKLPKYTNSLNERKISVPYTQPRNVKWYPYTCSPFLFNPRMDLVV